MTGHCEKYMDDPDFIPFQSLQVTIVGLGLMGGSLAMRLKQTRTVRRVTALVRRAETIAEAERVGAVDFATTDPQTALVNADVIVFSTPVRILTAQLKQFSPFFKAGAIITDVGSTKREIMAVLDALPPRVHPVGSHPMCGKETSGLAAADPRLYEGATWVVSPLKRTPAHAVDTVRTLARAVGALPLTLDAVRHDRLVATISHLPYLLAAGLVLAAQSVAQDDPQVWDVSASGFKDTSRLAASNVQMMLDILLTNQDAVLEMLARVNTKLNALAEAIATGDEESLRVMLQTAAAQRIALYPPVASSPDD